MAPNDAVEEGLKNLSNSIIPSDEYLENGKEAANEIFKLLQDKSKFKLDRVYIGGSVGKKTAVLSCDFDCVIMINDKESQFKDSLEDFKDILILSNLKLDPPKLTPFSIQFTYKGYDFDVLSAPNYVNHLSQQPSMPSLGAREALYILQQIEQDPSKGYYYSAGLCEMTLTFFRQQGSFIHQLMRLCKLWNKSLFIEGYISGRSTLIEHVAVYAGQMEKKKMLESDWSFLSGFQNFLKLMSNFNSIAILFDYDPLKESNSRWRPTPDPRVKTCPYVIEAVNCYNNLAKSLNEKQIAQFTSYAKVTLERLRLCFYSQAFVPLDIVFEPQPRIIPYLSDRQASFFQTASFALGVKINQGGSKFPNMIIRKEAKYKDQDMQDILKQMQFVFLTVVQSFVNSISVQENNLNGEDIRKGLQNRLEKCVDENVRGMEHTSWTSSVLRHEDYDVTFEIPFEGSCGKFCAYISLSSGKSG